MVTIGVMGVRAVVIYIGVIGFSGIMIATSRFVR
jgi:hypothetical protein